MVGKSQERDSSLVEEVELLHKAKSSPREGAAAAAVSRGPLSQWKCKLLGYLDGLRARRTRCVVCLQVQHVAGLPPAVEGRGIVVGWRSKGCKGEHTVPVQASRGAAAFDEVFLHYFSADAGGAVLKSFTVWVALVDSVGGDLGTFHVDLGELAAAESSNPRFGGKALSFVLGGAASGAVLTLSVYCRVMEQEENHGVTDHAGERKNKGKCFSSCLPDLGCLRNRPVAVAAAASARRATSLRSDRGGFITIENSMADVEGLRVEDDEEGAGFITIEKGTISSRTSRRPPSDNLATTDDDENGVPEDEKPCLFMELTEDFDVDKVEDEFLAMLEEKHWKTRDVEKSLCMSLDLGLDLDLDLDSLIKEAEVELAKAAQAWKSRVGAAILEKEEYEELVRRWSARENPSSSPGCSWGYGFGSPI